MKWIKLFFGVTIFTSLFFTNINTVEATEITDTPIYEEYIHLLKSLNGEDFIDAGLYIERMDNYAELTDNEVDQLVMEYLVENSKKVSIGIFSSSLPPTSYGGLNSKEMDLCNCQVQLCTFCQITLCTFVT